jgi:hypothetical protein
LLLIKIIDVIFDVIFFKCNNNYLLVLKELPQEIMAVNTLKKFSFLRKETSKGRVFLYCKLCGFDEKKKQSMQWYVEDIYRNFDFNMLQHSIGVEHIQKNKKTQTLISSFLLRIDPGPRDYTDPISAAACLGYWEMKDEEREMMMQLPPALWPVDIFRFDFGLLAELQSIITNARGEPLVQVNVRGAIRSAKCIKVCPYENECFEKFTCISCALLPDRRSFRNLVERRIERVAGQMLQLNYEYDII